MRATVSHFELPARDPARAARFYRKVFGWKVDALSGWGGRYYTVRTEAPETPPPGAQPGAIGGGLGDAQTVGNDQPLLVVHVEGTSLTDCLMRIGRAGGVIVEAPRPVGRSGFFARFRDPEGNLLGLWGQEER